jgi:hypothetical protein
MSISNIGWQYRTVIDFNFRFSGLNKSDFYNNIKDSYIIIYIFYLLNVCEIFLFFDFSDQS